MQTDNKATEIINKLYSAYGSGTGILFGIADKAVVEAIVNFALDYSAPLPDQHPQETSTDKGKGAIVGLEDAALIEYPIIEGFKNIDLDVVNEQKREAFKEGAEWHNNTHHLPLVELAKELKEALRGTLNAYYRATNAKPLTPTKEELEVEALITKANNLLNNK